MITHDDYWMLPTKSSSSSGSRGRLRHCIPLLMPPNVIIWAVISERSKDHWCKRDYRILARAAIAETLAAIREPTQAMFNNGQNSVSCRGDAADAYRKMIDTLAAEIRKGM